MPIKDLTFVMYMSIVLSIAGLTTGIVLHVIWRYDLTEVIPEKPQKEPYVDFNSYSCNDVYITHMAKMVHSECGTCSMEERDSIAQSVMNRVNHENFPNDIISVIYQKDQYQAVTGKNVKFSDETWFICETVYQRMYDTEILYFCTNNPDWENDKKRLKGKSNFKHKMFGDDRR